jgi:uncharacterized protein (TIGR02444 family)
MAADVEGQASDFWGFALALYNRFPEVWNDLQDRDGRDVNLALLCVWAGMARGLELDIEDLVTLEAALEPWRGQVVEPLRRVRRFLKGDSLAAPLRERVKAAELDAERVGQRLLLAALPDRALETPSEALGIANFARYAGAAAAGMLTASLAADAAADPPPTG